MNRKRWSELSPAYRKRLERSGITREMHARGDSLVRARGHFHSPKKRPGLAKRERQMAEEWNRLRYRARKLAAFESIRDAVRNEEIRTDPQVLRDVIEFYEALEQQYEEDGPEGNDYMQEWERWYLYMMDLYPHDFLLPPLDPYYHGRVGK